LGWLGTPATARVRPPRKGPIERQRIPAKYFASYGWPKVIDAAAAKSSIVKMVFTRRVRDLIALPPDARAKIRSPDRPILPH
jgi:hypothetical protein